MTSADVDLSRMLHGVGGGRAAVLGVWTTSDVSVRLRRIRLLSAI